MKTLEVKLTAKQKELVGKALEGLDAPEGTHLNGSRVFTFPVDADFLDNLAGRLAKMESRASDNAIEKIRDEVTTYLATEEADQDDAEAVLEEEAHAEEVEADVAEAEEEEEEAAEEEVVEDEEPEAEAEAEAKPNKWSATGAWRQLQYASVAAGYGRGYRKRCETDDGGKDLSIAEATKRIAEGAETIVMRISKVRAQEPSELAVLEVTFPEHGNPQATLANEQGKSHYEVTAPEEE